MRSIVLLAALSLAVTGCKKEDDRDEDGVLDAADCAPDDPAYAEEQTWQNDRDGDGYGVNSVGCLPPENAVDLPGDCNDNDADVHPEADELCNDRDDDCDAEVDDRAVDALRWSRDSDDDGYGSVSGAVEVCEPPFGFVSEGGDCNDSDADIHPGVDEVCDGVDEDCDGAIDDDPVGAPRWYRDADEDGYGTVDDAVNECEQPAGYIAASGDCDDADAWLNPGEIEYCNGLDDDCDGLLDKDDPDEAGDATWYLDADSDGWGTPDSTTTACAQPTGYARFDFDCDDSSAAVSPDATEVCLNGLDDNCDGAAAGCGEEGETALSDGAFASWTGPGESAYLGLGRGLTAVGDWDADGLPELALGAQGASGFTGAVYFPKGGSAGSASANDVTALTGAAASDYVGYAVAAAGDTDGDGLADVLIGGPGVGGFAGAAWLVRGPVATSGAISSAAWATLSGPAGSQAGFAVGSAGDQDGDGRADLLVSANTAEGGSGRVYLVSATVAGAADLESAAFATVTGAVGEGVGWSASAGDITGDGLEDLAVGGLFDANYTGQAWLFEGPVTSDVATAEGGSGRVYLVSATVAGAADLESAAFATVTGAVGEGAGLSASTGDITGDGLADLAVGGLLDANVTGQAWLFEGPVTSDVATADGAPVYAEQVGSVASVAMELRGDYDGDGYADLAVGASGWDDTVTPDSGRVYVVFGPVGEEVALADADALFDGQTGGGCGAAVSWAGSPNGDDLDDLAIGCLYGWDSINAYGLAALVYGGFEAGTHPLASTGRRWAGSVAYDVVGGGVGPAGDQDGDGVDDLLISASYESSAAAYAGKVSVVLGASGF